MARQQVEHVIEKTDAGCNRPTPGPVEIDRDLDISFLGGALHGCLPHELSRPVDLAVFYQGVRLFATAAWDLNKPGNALPMAEAIAL